MVIGGEDVVGAVAVPTAGNIVHAGGKPLAVSTLLVVLELVVVTIAALNRGESALVWHIFDGIVTLDTVEIAVDGGCKNLGVDNRRLCSVTVETLVVLYGQSRRHTGDNDQTGQQSGRKRRAEKRDEW